MVYRCEENPRRSLQSRLRSSPLCDVSQVRMQMTLRCQTEKSFTVGKTRSATPEKLVGSKTNPEYPVSGNCHALMCFRVGPSADSCTTAQNTFRSPPSAPASRVRLGVCRMCKVGSDGLWHHRTLGTNL